MRIPLPNNFRGDKFASKYNLTVDDFWAEGDELVVPDGIYDTSDCITTDEELVLPLINKLWQKTWDHVYTQLALQDMTVISGWYSANVLNAEGRAGFEALINWQDQLFSNEYMNAKEAITIAKQWIEPDWNTWTLCPKDFYFFYNNRTF